MPSGTSVGGEAKKPEKKFFPNQMKKMTNPILWGTGLWQLLFQAANNQDANVEVLVTHVFEFLPLLLPCRECRANYPRHAKRVEVRFGNRRLKTPRDVFRWLYLLKDEVGKQLGRSSPPLKHIELAYEHHGSLTTKCVLPTRSSQSRSRRTQWSWTRFTYVSATCCRG